MKPSEIIIPHNTDAHDFGVEWPGSNFMQGIRAYRSSPAGATIQLRHHGPTNKSCRGRRRFVVVSADYVTRDELDSLIGTLQTIRNELQAERVER